MLGRLTEQLTPRVLAVFTSSPAWCCCSPARRRRPTDAWRCSAVCCRFGDRGVALPCERRGRRAAPAVAGARATSGRRLLSRVGPADPRHHGVAAQGLRLRRGHAAAARSRGACGGRGRPSIGAPRFSRRGFQLPGSRPWSARSARPCGSGSLRSSTWSIRTSSGGSSSCRATRRGSCVRRSVRRSCSCCLGLRA